MKRTVMIDFIATISVDVEIEVGDVASLTILDEDDLAPEKLEEARMLAANQGIDPDDLEVDAIWIRPKSKENRDV